MDYNFINADRNVTKEDIPEVKEWMKNEDINQLIPEQNHTLLEYAVMGGVLEVTKFLIENGADPTVYSGYWFSLIELAAMYGQLETIKYLMTNEQCREAFNDDNSLIDAAFYGYPEIVKYLIKQGKDIESYQDYRGECTPDIGYTALRAAAQENQVETVKLLCEMGANVNVEGEDTPLYSASAQGYLEVVKILIDYGADVNKSLENGVTPLQIACNWEQYDVAKYLLEHGADPTVVDNDGHTCLQQARHNGGNRRLENLILDAMKNYKK